MFKVHLTLTAYFYTSLFYVCLVAGQSPKYALKGLEVKLKPDITGQPDEILWKHNGNKVVEFNGNEQQVYRPYENRITLDWVSAELDIANLRYEDTGQYTLEAYMNKLFRRVDLQLEVIGKFFLLNSLTVNRSTLALAFNSWKLMCCNSMPLKSWIKTQHTKKIDRLQ